MGQTIDAKCEALDQHGRVLSVADVSKQLKLQLKTSVDIMDIKYSSYFVFQELLVLSIKNDFYIPTV